MSKKYFKRENSTIDKDYVFYLAQENIYTVLYGHKPKGYQKSDYIWKRLLIEYGYNQRIDERN